MTRFAHPTIPACCAALLLLAAHAGPGPSVYLKNYYTEYEVVKDCAEHGHLSAGDAAKAKDAMGKIEAHYLKLDPKIKKDALMKVAVAHKNAAFKMMRETSKVDPGQFCRASLNDLVSKLHDVEAAAQ
jgi:hypothetical protein